MTASDYTVKLSGKKPRPVRTGRGAAEQCHAPARLPGRLLILAVREDATVQDNGNTESQMGHRRPVFEPNRASCLGCISQLQRRPRLVTRSCRQGRLLSDCYHGTLPRPTKQRRTGQACMCTTLHHITLHYMTLLRYTTLHYSAVRCPAPVRLSGADNYCHWQAICTSVVSAADHVSRGRGPHVAFYPATMRRDELANTTFEYDLPERTVLWHARPLAINMSVSPPINTLITY